ncbi:hypothetical protein PPERSA_05603 [Pseudocohnilembus persalinus]|uniref:Transmembrane protein n=1 Tax=Pseudocohnilembus persalinus TaxID=266149 RepID=A0A0V0QDY3_PSEPJ|nr:hypothetical protein PPERSA_05603 [Pseudocohnilembus persalinus]|eukprot:KRX00426.1 hypothetical protein PPERSA_05603 [Pseudocohnilembus persalinus]
MACLVRTDYNFAFALFGYYLWISREDKANSLMLMALNGVLLVVDIIWYFSVASIWKTPGSQAWQDLSGIHSWAIFWSVINTVLKIIQNYLKMGGNCSKLKKIDIEEPYNSKNNNIVSQKPIDQIYDENQFKQNKTISKQLIDDIKKLPYVPEKSPKNIKFKKNGKTRTFCFNSSNHNQKYIQQQNLQNIYQNDKQLNSNPVNQPIIMQNKQKQQNNTNQQSYQRLQIKKNNSFDQNYKLQSEEYYFDYFDKELEEEYNIIRIQEKIQQYLQKKSLKKYSSIKSNKNTNYESQESTAKSKNLSKVGNNIFLQKNLSIDTQINEKNNKNENHDYAINSTSLTQNFDNHQQQQQFYQLQQQIKDSDNSEQIKEEDYDDENDILSQESSFGPELNVDLQYVDAISVQRKLQKLEFLQQQVVNQGEV